MYRKIPKMDDILARDSMSSELASNNPDVIKDIINKVLNMLRNSIKQGITEDELDEKLQKLDEMVLDELNLSKADKLIPLVNGTGTVIHTNFGRSLVDEEMAESVKNVLTSYSNLEFDLETGKRGSRYSIVESLIMDVTGAEAAMVVNNNAAAVLLVLSSFAKGKEAIISRGELIEIGGSFRIPDVMEASGCQLKEVGTTNKTHLFDYERAVNENTGVILKVHTSNYKVMGFTESVASEDLKRLADKEKLPLIEDLGSGVLIDLEKYGMTHEPTVQESIRAGVDIVTFSGDKLLGGPQAGIIVGKKKYIDILKNNQLTRALRVDKMTLKLLEEIFKIYRFSKEPVKKIPTLRMITKSKEEIALVANYLKEELSKLGFSAICINDYSEVGGGSLPTERLDSVVVEIKHKDIDVVDIDRFMRKQEIPIIGRLHKDSFYLDPRTLKEDDEKIIIETFKKLKETVRR